jgi:hypothetical protein
LIHRAGQRPMRLRVIPARAALLLFAHSDSAAAVMV